MKKFKFIAGCLLAGCVSVAYADSSRAYGVRVYSDTEGDRQALVSFAVDDPMRISVEAEWPGYTVTAAACDGDTYYLFHTDDGMTVAKMLTYNMTTRRLSEARTFDFKNDLIGKLTILDMTYDAVTEQIYGVGFNIADAEIVDNKVNVPYGLYRIDPATGDAELVGLQEVSAVISIAAGATDMLGVDEIGRIWKINRYSGELETHLADTGIIPVSIQSMAYDFGNDKYYWASYTFGESEDIGISTMIEMSLTGMGALNFGEYLPVADSSELIGLYIDHNPLDRRSPAAASALSITPGAYGAPDAVISWTAPAATLDGDPLSEVTACIYRNDARIGTVGGLSAGSDGSFTDTGVESGMYVYSLSFEADGLEGPRTYADSVFVGMDTPGVPANISAVKSADSFDITVTWERPLAGAHGGWYDPEGIRYRVVRYPDVKVMAESTDLLTLTDTTITDLHGYYYTICTLKDGSYGPEASTLPVISGPAIEPPYMMDLSGADQANLWTVYDADGDGYAWYIYYTGWGGTWDPFFRYYPENIIHPDGVADDWLISPPFALEAGRPYVVQYDVRLLGALFPADTELTIGTSADPESMTGVLETNEREITDIEWVRHSVSFKVDRTGNYNFGYHVLNLMPVQMYQFAVKEIPSVDLSVTAPAGAATARVGVPNDYRVVVTNTGYEAVGNYTVELVDQSGVLLASAEADSILASQSSVTMTIAWTPSAAGEYVVSARVRAEGDGDSSNDTAGTLGVTVLGDGFEIDLTSGTGASGFVPVYTRSYSSISQNLYTAEQLDNGHSGTIQGISYYPFSFFGYGQNEYTMDMEIWMANTDRSVFDDAAPLDQEEFTKVFDAPVTLTADTRTVDLILDSTFEYTGGNLCIQVRHRAETIASIAFRVYYNMDGPATAIAADNNEDKADFSGTVSTYPYQANILLRLTGGSSVGSVDEDQAAPQIVYDRAARVIRITGDYDTCTLVSASGSELGTYSGSEVISLSDCQPGVVLVRVTSGRHTSICKVIIN